MDLRLTPDEEHFRREVRTWLESNLPTGWGTPAYQAPEGAAAVVDFARGWQQKLHEGGWAGLTWPRECGGRDASYVEQLLFGEEYARAQAPDLMTISVGTGLVGPTIIAKGTAAQRERFLENILTGKEVWCQGFSEPGAGSDLASLRTRGEVKGESIIVSGQKTWTSFAMLSDWCILVVRTDPDSERHGGLSFLLVDMKSPGITIRPLKEMTGHAWFNEVFFDHVVVPKENVVGEIHHGWDVVIATLMHERSATAGHVRLQIEQERLAALARRDASADGKKRLDPLTRQQLAQHAIDCTILRYTAYRNVTKLQRDGVPGPEGSTVKLFASELEQRIQQSASELLGPRGLLVADDPRTVEHGHWNYELLWSRAATIYAGTSEIQRNIIAQRVLGLPR